MFRLDIEDKIIDFVKKSPIGVTSSEIAKYLNINRMTLAKYLEIIKEKTLLDFKQLGMTKVWYIPVNINRDKFLTSIIADLAQNIDKENIRGAASKIGMKIGKNVEQLYKRFYGVERLNLEQLSEAIVDFEKKIGGDFFVVEKTHEKIILRNNKCPFGNNKIKECPELCAITSGIFGIIAARNFGYGKVCLKRTIAKADDDYIILFLKKTEESEKEKATDYVATD